MSVRREAANMFPIIADMRGEVGRASVGAFRLFTVLLRRTLMQKIRMHGLFLQNLSTIMLFGLLVVRCRADGKG
jgi:hypothetical protein